jgi:hypothetical protein
LRDKNNDREDKMSVAYINDAKGMAKTLLSREFRGPGDTIEAAAHRIQMKFGVPASVILRLRHREVKDMLMSNFMALASAYRAASERLDRAFEHEREVAIDPKILRLADFVAGKKNREEA